MIKKIILLFFLVRRWVEFFVNFWILNWICIWILCCVGGVRVGCCCFCGFQSAAPACFWKKTSKEFNKKDAKRRKQTQTFAKKFLQRSKLAPELVTEEEHTLVWSSDGLTFTPPHHVTGECWYFPVCRTTNEGFRPPLWVPSFRIAWRVTGRFCWQKGCIWVKNIKLINGKSRLTA